MKTAVRRTLLAMVVALSTTMAGLRAGIPAPAGVAAAGGLYVQGNQLYDNDSPVIPHGVNRSGTEAHCLGGPGFADGPTDAASVQAIASWHANIVRVPLNEDCWLGINGVAIGGAAYQQDIVDWVNTLVSNGMLVVLDLHVNAPGTILSRNQEPMADLDHGPAFWSSVANTFKSNTQVMFDLYNEPDPIPWTSTYPGGFQAWQNADFACLRDGCTATATEGGTFQTAGMQQLVDAVRGTGAANVVLIAGITYGFTISQYLGDSDTPGNYLPHDPVGNLVVATHMYAQDACADLTCWNSSIAPVAAKYPVLATEIGDTNCTSDFITQVMPWLDGHWIGYLAWDWGTDFGCQSLISSYGGSPTSPYGLAYRSHLAAAPGSPPTATSTATPSPATATGTATATATATRPAPTSTPTGGAAFSTGFESGQPQPSWTNTVDSGGYPSGGLLNAGGICCGLPGPEVGVRNERAHSGSAALMYSGMDNSSSTSYAYDRVFDLSGQPLKVGSSTALSYWIFPQSNSTSPVAVSGSNSSCVAIDLIFSDGTNLRDSGAVDQSGNRLHPGAQCGHLALDSWDHVTSNIGAVAAGKSIIRIDLGYDQPANTGGYRGYLDDLSIQ